ncbi:MAG TPA: hypothetical protein VJ276_03665 [Thermoanaerobaculia bacterium]|nr:hypothetical protein [Thermoanaerobaculia bacterium]
MRPHSAIASAMAVGAGLLPKCPLCFLALGSAAGLELRGAWLAPLVAVCVGTSLLLIGRMAAAQRRWWPLLTAAAAAAIVIAARIGGAPPLVTHAGALLMAVAALSAGRTQRCQM